MAKKDNGLSFADFDEDNLLDDVDLNEEEDQEDEEQEDADDSDKKKKKSKSKAAASEEEESEDEDEEEEEEEPAKKRKATKSKKKEEPLEEEDEEEEQEDENEDSSDEDEDEDDDQGPDPKQFFEAVEKLTGSEVEVDYGDVDPLTPQGIALREKAVREDAINQFVEELKNTHPAVHEALQYAYNGGDIAELFTSTSSRDYSKVELKEGDDDLAIEILKEYYHSRGVKNEGRIKRLIEAAQDSDDGVLKEAQSALKELVEEQESRREELLEQQEKKNEERRKRDGLLLEAVDSVLEDGKLGNFKIAKQDVREFRDFVVSNIRRAKDDKYEFATPINPANLDQLLKFQYFQYKKGDLSQLIEIKANTKNAEKLKLRLKAEQKKAKKNSQQDEQKTKYSMKDFDQE